VEGMGDMRRKRGDEGKEREGKEKLHLGAHLSVCTF